MKLKFVLATLLLLLFSVSALANTDLVGVQISFSFSGRYIEYNVTDPSGNVSGIDPATRKKVGRGYIVVALDDSEQKDGKYIESEPSAHVDFEGNHPLGIYKLHVFKKHGVRLKRNHLVHFDIAGGASLPQAKYGDKRVHFDDKIGGDIVMPPNGKCDIDVKFSFDEPAKKIHVSPQSSCLVK